MSTSPRPTCLFLAHRIPYPADKGDKLRALAWLRHLSCDFAVTLVAGVDDAADWKHEAALNEIAERVILAPVGGLKSTVRGSLRLLAGRDLSTGYFRIPSVARQLAALPRFDLCFIYSSGASGYLDDLAEPPVTTVVDFVDVDSAKWEQMARDGRGPVALLKGLEARALARREASLARGADASLFATWPEAQLFKERSGIEDGLYALENGVDTETWATGRDLPSPYPGGEGPTLILTGAMDYAPNVDGAVWFAEEILPQIRKIHKSARFVIAGARPTARLVELGRRPAITVTGRVADMRPWLAHADISVAPLRLARGVQNKVLEAMASGVPVIATNAALEGISAEAGTHALAADTADTFAQTCLSLLAEPERAATLARSAQELMRDRYDWTAKTTRLSEIIAEARQRAGSLA